MLIDVGCRFAIVGHSERRQMLGENDRFINRKVHAGLEAGLSMIVCIGETLAQREADQTEDVLKSQLLGSLESVRAADADRMVIAYEPVWAIGTGRNATPEQAQLAHAFIRRQVAAQLGSDAANAMVIQYGGSVKPDNAAAILSQPDVDGALVGGASLKAESFLAIARAAG
jgi:triosephosphate isomerase